MPAINVSEQDKRWFDSFQEEGESHAEAFERLRRQSEAFDGTLIDPEELADELKPLIAAGIEVGAYRGVKTYMEDNGD